MTEFYKAYVRAGLPVLLAVVTAALIWNVKPAAARDGAIPDDLRVEETFRPGPGKSVGNVTLIQGKAVIRHEKEDRSYLIREGMALFNGDTIYTGGDCHLELALNDGSDLVLSSDTKIVIDKSIYDPDSGSRLSFFQMLSGKARFIVKKLSDYKHSQFNVKTESSVVGVRGSDFIIEISQQGDKIVITALGHTILEIIDPANPLNEPVIVTSFQQLVTVLGQIFGQPVDLSEEEIMKLLEELGLLQQGDGQGGGTGGGQGGFIPYGGNTQGPFGGDFFGNFPGFLEFIPILPPPIFGPGPDDPFYNDPGAWIKPPLILPLPDLPDMPTE